MSELVNGGAVNGLGGTFPISDGPPIPLGMIQPQADHAKLLWRADLETLEQCGGLTSAQALAAIKGLSRRDAMEMDAGHAQRQLYCATLLFMLRGSTGSPPLLSDEWQIVGSDGGKMDGTNGHVHLTVYPEGKTKMRKTTVIKGAGTIMGHKEQILWAELDGVRATVVERGNQVHIILGRQALI